MNAITKLDRVVQAIRKLGNGYHNEEKKTPVADKLYEEFPEFVVDNQYFKHFRSEEWLFEELQLRTAEVLIYHHIQPK